ncbi:MAG: GPW/gp25 family protein [Methanotrichaceae archaeon]|nr:GPW/gp25 family protein [Methanotrichaceae archaeon]
MMQIRSPFEIDLMGRTAQSGEEAHIREMIEAVLFTSPGERVNRPDFGSGLLQLTFAPNSGELATATQFLVQASLQRWLGDRIQVEAVRITSDEATLDVTVQYIVRRDGERKVAEFKREV